MSFDPKKLTSAPWTISKQIHLSDWNIIGPGTVGKVGESRKENDAAFIAAARNAFDVMMRRSFSVVKTEKGTFGVLVEGNNLPSMWIGFTSPYSGTLLTWPDPFTALIEADRWYRENGDNRLTAGK